MNLLDYLAETLRRARDVAVEDLPKIAEEVAGAVDATIKAAVNTESASRDARMQALSMVLMHRKDSQYMPPGAVVEEAGTFAAFIALGVVPVTPPPVVVEGPAESGPVSLGLDEVPAGDVATSGEGAA